MKKTLISVLLSVILLVALSLPAFAVPENGYIYDYDDALSSTAVQQLNETAEQLEETYGVVLLFASSYSAEDAYELSSEVYEKAGSPEKALVLSLTAEYYDIAATESVEYIFTEDTEDSIWLAFADNDTDFDAVMAYYQAAEEALIKAAGSSSDPIISKGSLLVDDQDLLTDTEKQSVLSALDNASSLAGLDIVVLTTDELDEYNDEAFCDDYYDYNGYGQGTERSGLLLAFDANDGLWYISTRGYAITAFTDYGIDELFDSIRPALRSGDYAEAFTAFADNCVSYVEAANAGEPIDVPGYVTREKESFSEIAGRNLIISLIIGLVVALIAVSKMKAKLKTVHKQYSAEGYVRPGSLQLTESRDMFLYNKVTSRPRPTESSSRSGGSSTHSSSSGASHGGHGGRL